jgi:hypothetical protein
MCSRSKKQQRYDVWPIDDRRCWETAFRRGEFLDEAGAGAHLSEATCAALKAAYSRFLGFLVRQYPERLDRPAAARVDRETIVKYVEHIRQSRADTRACLQLGGLCTRTDQNQTRNTVLFCSAAGTLGIPKSVVE